MMMMTIVTKIVMKMYITACDDLITNNQKIRLMTSSEVVKLKSAGLV